MKYLICLFILSTIDSYGQKALTQYQLNLIKAQKISNSALKLPRYSEDLNERKAKYSRVIQVIDSALTINPNYFFALKNKFKIQYLIEDYNGMLLTINRIINVRPMKSAIFETHKAKVYELLREEQKAKETYELAIKKFEHRLKTINPIAIDWIERVDYAQTLFFAGYTEKAKKEYTETRKKHPNEPYLKKELNLFKDYTSIMKYWNFSEDGTDYTQPWYKAPKNK